MERLTTCTIMYVIIYWIYELLKTARILYMNILECLRTAGQQESNRGYLDWSASIYDAVTDTRHHHHHHHVRSLTG